MIKGAISRTPFQTLLASIIFVGGCGWAIVTIMRGGSTPALTMSSPSDQKTVALVAATPAAQPSTTDSEHQAAVTRAAGSVKASLLVTETQRLPNSDAEALAQEAVESLLLAASMHTPKASTSPIFRL